MKVTGSFKTNVNLSDLRPGSKFIFGGRYHVLVRDDPEEHGEMKAVCLSDGALIRIPANAKVAREVPQGLMVAYQDVKCGTIIRVKGQVLITSDYVDKEIGYYSLNLASGEMVSFNPVDMVEIVSLDEYFTISN